MPKIRDLGIKVVPEGMRPLEIGGGAAGACGCTLTCDCSNPVTICDCTTEVTFCICTLLTCGATCACSNPVTWICECSNPVTFIGAAQPQQQPLTRTDIETLRQQLRQRLEELDRQESAIAEAREKELEAELERLRKRREELKK